MLTIVELFGLPGAGKTTVATAAAGGSDVLTRKALSAAWADESILAQAAHVVHGLADLKQLGPAARLARRGAVANPASLFHLLRVLAKSHWLRSHDGVLLLDQGYLQDLWSILYSADCEEPDPQSLSGLVKALYRGTETKILLVEVDPQTAAARVTGRTHGHSRFDAMRGASLFEALSRATMVQRAIVEACKVAGLDVETVDGSAPAHLLARRLRNDLRPRASDRDECVGIFAA